MCCNKCSSSYLLLLFSYKSIRKHVQKKKCKAFFHCFMWRSDSRLCFFQSRWIFISWLLSGSQRFLKSPFTQRMNVQFKKVFSGAIHCWANDSLTATALLLQTASGIALVLHPTDQEHELFSMNCIRIKTKLHPKYAPEKWGHRGKKNKAWEWDN